MMRKISKEIIALAKTAINTNDTKIAKKIAAVISEADIIWYSYLSKKDRPGVRSKSKLDDIRNIFKDVSRAWIFINDSGKEITIGTAKRKFKDSEGKAKIKQLDPMTYAIQLGRGCVCVMCL